MWGGMRFAVSGTSAWPLKALASRSFIKEWSASVVCGIFLSSWNENRLPSQFNEDRLLRQHCNIDRVASSRKKSGNVHLITTHISQRWGFAINFYPKAYVDVGK